MHNLKRAGLVVLLMSLLSMGGAAYADPPLPTPVGRVAWVKGTLKATMENNEQRILQKMSVIYLHDVLTTDAASQAQIVFTDESLITFYPNTKFSIEKYVYEQKKKGSTGSYVMNLIEGGFRTITGLIAKNNPSDYHVNTPVATIGVRGTDYAAYIKGSELYVGHYSGKPCVSNKKSGELCLSDATPYAYVPTVGAAPVPVAQQPVVFKEKLVIVPFNIAPFGGVSPQGSAGSARGGPVSSFCISQ